MNESKNWNCENDKCTSDVGEVRVLPTGGGSNAILCRACFEHEMRWRGRENAERDPLFPYRIESWENLKVYEGGEA